jgi:hypothetical protein
MPLLRTGCTLCNNPSKTTSRSSLDIYITAPLQHGYLKIMQWHNESYPVSTE